MMKCAQIMTMIEQLAPKKMAESWDNPGLLVGSPQQEVQKILVCLDVSQLVVEKAIELQVDMIIAHHPMIFKGLRQVRTDLYTGKLLQQILQNNMAVYAAHTNLDIAVGGVNDVLAEKIGLTSVTKFVPVEGFPEESMGRIGYLPQPMDLGEFGQQVKTGLTADYVRIVRGNDKPIKKVALCSGSGADFIPKAAFKGADVLVTGDLKYHEAQRARELGLNVIDGGHFATEFPMVTVLADYLQQAIEKAGGQVEVMEDKWSKDYFEVLI